MSLACRLWYQSTPSHQAPIEHNLHFSLLVFLSKTPYQFILCMIHCSWTFLTIESTQRTVAHGQYVMIFQELYETLLWVAWTQLYLIANRLDLAVCQHIG